MTILTAAQRVAIAEVLRVRGLDSALFRWEGVAGEAVGSVGWQEPCLRYIGSEFTFCLYQDPYSAWCVVFSPGEDQSRSTVGKLSWAGVLDHLEIWAVVLRAELKAVDPWSIVDHIASGAESSGSVDNGPFTAEERESVARSLEEVLRELRGHAAYSAVQFEIIQQQFAEMRAASERIGKKDWVTMSLGTIMSTAMAAALDPLQAQHLWSALSSSLTWLSSMPRLKP